MKGWNTINRPRDWSRFSPARRCSKHWSSCCWTENLSRQYRHFAHVRKLFWWPSFHFRCRHVHRYRRSNSNPLVGSAVAAAAAARSHWSVKWFCGDHQPFQGTVRAGLCSLLEAGPSQWSQGRARRWHGVRDVIMSISVRLIPGSSWEGMTQAHPALLPYAGALRVWVEDKGVPGPHGWELTHSKRYPLSSQTFPSDRTAGVSSSNCTVTNRFRWWTYTWASSFVCTSP